MDPISLALVRRRRGGFEGPFVAGKHQFMVRRGHRLILPNPHVADIGPGLLAELLREAGVRRDEWEAER